MRREARRTAWRAVVSSVVYREGVEEVDIVDGRGSAAEVWMILGWS